MGSFAFQGTNGQAVMGAEPDRPTAPRAVAGSRSALRLLDSQWHWVLNPKHGWALQVHPQVDLGLTVLGVGA